MSLVWDPFPGHQPGSGDLEKEPAERQQGPASFPLPRKASEIFGSAKVGLPAFLPPFYLAVKRKEVGSRHDSIYVKF